MLAGHFCPFVFSLSQYVLGCREKFGCRLGTTWLYVVHISTVQKNFEQFRFQRERDGEIWPPKILLNSQDARQLGHHMCGTLHAPKFFLGCRVSFPFFAKQTKSARKQLMQAKRMTCLEISILTFLGRLANEKSPIFIQPK